jgi:hypothetical protein
MARWDTDTVASDITVAFIGGAAGLLTGAVTGTISSLIAPWANWGAEKKRRQQDRRVERIAEWRKGVDEVAFAEGEAFSPSSSSSGVFVSARDLDWDVRSKDWYVTLKSQMSPDVANEVEALSAKPLKSRLGEVPRLLRNEIMRIEEEKWELV